LNNTVKMIRTNIKLLQPYSKDIAQCKSFNEFAKIFWPAKNSDIDNEIKGAVGENFFDELCMRYPNITGFSTTEFRPATPDEDYYEAVDTIGKTLKEIKGRQQDAIRQDKAYNPFNPNSKLGWDEISRVLKKAKKGEIDPDYIFICTFLHENQLTNEVKDYFEWRVCRNHFENALKSNGEFFRNFAKRINNESKELDRQHNTIITNAKKALKKYKPMSFQKEAVKHSQNYKVVFIQLPPGSGKTNIQREVALIYFEESDIVVYVAPTLDLLDQNFYKVTLYLKTIGLDFKTVMICSRRTFTTNQGPTAFLDDNEIVYGNVHNQEVIDALLSNKKKLVGVTYTSYESLVRFSKQYDIKFDRIADEALEIVPGKELYKEVKDADEEKSRWHSFADMSVINRSASFDAFEKLSKSDNGPGTNNLDVFGKRISKTFPEMINDFGTIVNLQLRVITVTSKQNSKHHRDWWSDEDKLNFNALCKAIDDLCNDNTFTNKKMIAFLHNAKICDHFKEPLANYVQGRINYVESIISGTKNRPELLQAYKDAKDAVLLNYGVLGKGIDDDSTPATFIGRNMVSVYGMHGIHRGCRSHRDEYGLPPEKHILKPFGIAYLIVVEDDKNSAMDCEDLKAMLKMLYGIGWEDNVKLVKPAKPKNEKDDPTNPPVSNTTLVDVSADKRIMDQMIIIKETFDSNAIINSITSLENFFDIVESL
jgi:hypothetical protein